MPQQYPQVTGQEVPPMTQDQEVNGDMHPMAFVDLVQQPPKKTSIIRRVPDKPTKDLTTPDFVQMFRAVPEEVESDPSMSPDVDVELDPLFSFDPELHFDQFDWESSPRPDPDPITSAAGLEALGNGTGYEPMLRSISDPMPPVCHGLDAGDTAWLATDSQEPRNEARLNSTFSSALPGINHNDHDRGVSPGMKRRRGADQRESNARLRGGEQKRPMPSQYRVPDSPSDTQPETNPSDNFLKAVDTTKLGGDSSSNGALGLAAPTLPLAVIDDPQQQPLEPAASGSAADLNSDETPNLPLLASKNRDLLLDPSDNCWHNQQLESYPMDLNHRDSGTRALMSGLPTADAPIVPFHNPNVLCAASSSALPVPTGSSIGPSAYHPTFEDGQWQQEGIGRRQITPGFIEELQPSSQDLQLQDEPYDHNEDDFLPNNKGADQDPDAGLGHSRAGVLQDEADHEYDLLSVGNNSQRVGRERHRGIPLSHSNYLSLAVVQSRTSYPFSGTAHPLQNPQQIPDLKQYRENQLRDDGQYDSRLFSQPTYANRNEQALNCIGGPTELPGIYAASLGSRIAHGPSPDPADDEKILGPIWDSSKIQGPDSRLRQSWSDSRPVMGHHSSANQYSFPTAGENPGSYLGSITGNKRKRATGPEPFAYRDERADLPDYSGHEKPINLYTKNENVGDGDDALHNHNRIKRRKTFIVFQSQQPTQAVVNPTLSLQSGHHYTAVAPQTRGGDGECPELGFGKERKWWHRMTPENGLEVRKKNTDAWCKAVRHDEIRRKLFREAGDVGQYASPRARGPEAHDQTSYLLFMKNWDLRTRNGWKRIYGNVLMKFERRDWKAPNHIALPGGYLSYNHRLVVDRDFRPIYDWKVLPATLSSAFEGGYMEALRRICPGISTRDFWARMPEYVKKPTDADPDGKPVEGYAAINMRCTRFRERNGLVSWLQRKGTPGYKLAVWNSLSQHDRDNNSTEHFFGLSSTELKWAKKYNKARKAAQDAAAAGVEISDEDGGLDYD